MRREDPGMFSENEAITREVHDMAAAACLELFEAYGVGLARASADPEGPSDVLYCGVMGFVGQGVRGSCLLAASRTPLERSCPTPGPIRDWMGELTNQLVGRIKAKLLSRGVRVAMSTPIVLRGEHLRPLPRKNLPPMAFSVESGLLLLWVELEVAQDFELKEESEVADSTAVGEALFF